MTYVKSPEPRTVYLAVKTTSGYANHGEILDLAILDESGGVLMDTYVRPAWCISWAEGSRRHGIRPVDVADAPQLDTLRVAIRDAVADCTLVTFNSPADRRTPGMAGLMEPVAAVHCTMEKFSEHFDLWDEQQGRWQWPALSAAAHRVNIDLPAVPIRRALHDCQAIRAIWQYLTDPEERARVDALRAGAVPST